MQTEDIRDISELLLQREPMRFIRKVLDYGPDWVECLVDNSVTSFADHSGRKPSWVGLEYMCQAICALEGFTRLDRGQDVVPGVIIAARKLKAEVPFFEPQQELTVRVDTLISDSQNFGVYECSVSSGGELLVSGIITGVLAESPADLVKNAV